MDPVLKLRHTVDALFGRGVSAHLPRDSEIRMTFSRRTGRPKAAVHDGVGGGPRLLCTLRTDGGLAVTPYLAQLLLGSKTFRENCVEVSGDAAPFVMEGRSVFCRHVTWCGRRVRVSADTPVLFGGRVIAVGRAVLSHEMIGGFERGVAVRIRDSLKGRGREG